MGSEEFIIEFSYKGFEYTGRVTINEKKKKSTFLVRYSFDHSPQFEKEIELNAVVCVGSDPFDWKEVAHSFQLKKTDPGLITAIGYALEDRDI